MANRVVIGSQWGDEGKAKIVDFLTLDADIIVRFQGGANAGHTVEVGDQKFVFHLIPSGIMHADKICVIGNGVVLDPIQTLAEIADLHTKGINPEGRLFIANNAHVVLPYHSTLDKAKEKKAGKAAIGTTGRGIGPCYSDKVNRIGVRVGDLMDERELRPRVEAMAKVHNEEFTVMYDVPAIDPEVVIKDYLELGQKIKPFVIDVSEFLYKSVKAGKRLVFEGAQGTILDRKIGNEYGATTGRNRRCGWFDAPVVRKAAVVNGLTHLAITKLDVLDTFDTVKICTHYECDGEKLDFIPNQLSKVGRCTPVYEELPGWKQDTTKCRTYDELPENAKKYLQRMAELLDVKIGMISIGAKRDQSIVIDAGLAKGLGL